MIQSFGNLLAEDIFHSRKTRHTRHFPPELYQSARRKLYLINAAAGMDDLASPPGNRLEKLSGNLKQCWSIRINSQWRIIFEWDSTQADGVAIVDYH